MTGTIPPTAFRDRIAWALCNWVLRHVATGWYRTRIEGAIRYGLAAAVRDELADIAKGERKP